MRITLEWKWESLDEHTARSKVLGGWILHHVSFNEKKTQFSESMVFIEDRNHEWNICAPMVEEKSVKSMLAKEFESPKL